MKPVGLFRAISNGYFAGANNMFKYSSSCSWVGKPLVYPISVMAYPFLAGAGIFFYLFIIFDWISGMVDRLRKSILRTLIRLQQNIPNSPGDFLFNPVLIAAITPLFFLSALLPKFSSNIHPAFSDVMEDFSSGVFKQMNKVCWSASNALFVYVVKVHWLLKPVCALIAVFYSVGLIMIGACAGLFILLDLVSLLIEKIRTGVVNIVHRAANGISGGILHFLFLPAFLLFIAPFLIMVLIIPKLSSGLDRD